MKHMLDYTKKLEQMGFAREQAEGMVQTMYELTAREYYERVIFIAREVVNDSRHIFVTKKELSLAKKELKELIAGNSEEIRSIRQELSKLRDGLNELRHEMNEKFNSSFKNVCLMIVGSTTLTISILGTMLYYLKG